MDNDYDKKKTNGKKNFSSIRKDSKTLWWSFFLCKSFENKKNKMDND